ncbi:MAG TPA: Ku protein [Rickettsiales bacterium]|nr:Ku protein [Rickettsiales bacterium]
MALRPYWSGQIRLSLISIPVSIFPALNRSRHIPLHMIYRPTGQRIHHQNVVDGQPVEDEDIVKGYEVEKGEYVILEPEEIAELKIPSKRTLEIKEFIPAGSIDAVYHETPYFIVPDKDADEDAFVIIREALRDSSKVGLGQLAIGGRERLCSIKPCGSGLMLETLRYKDEVRDADPYFEDIQEGKIDEEALSLAKELIKRKTASFKPEKFHDHYREALQELIDAKREHREIRYTEEEKAPAKVVNLMDALRKSLQEKGSSRSTKRTATKTTGKKKAAAHPVKRKRAS